MDCHKLALAKEQAKGREYEQVIQEMGRRIAAVEKKNKDMHALVVKSNRVNNELQNLIQQAATNHTTIQVPVATPS